MKAPANLRTFVYATAEFVVRPYEVPCPRCAAPPWQLCSALSGPGKTKPIGHPARIALAQRLTKYHVYEMCNGNLVRTFDDAANALKWTRETAADVADDAGYVLAIRAGAAPVPSRIAYADDCDREGMLVIERILPAVAP